jgi:hypothetical protein
MEEDPNTSGDETEEQTQLAADEQVDSHPSCPQWVRSADRATEFAIEYSIACSLKDITKKVQLAEQNNISFEQVHGALTRTTNDAMESGWDEQAILYLVTAVRILKLEDKTFSGEFGQWQQLARILGKREGIEAYIQYHYQRAKYSN